MRRKETVLGLFPFLFYNNYKFRYIVMKIFEVLGFITINMLKSVTNCTTVDNGSKTF